MTTASMTGPFDDDYFDRLHAARTHWWVQGMHDIAWSLLDERRCGLTILDAGCGTGASLASLTRLAAPHRLHAVDTSEDALAYCHSLALPVDLARASIDALPFANGRFDLVVSMDVLQHLDGRREPAAIHEVRRVLRPGGRFLLRTNSAFCRTRVPEREDWRLYRPEALEHALTQAGLAVEVVTSVNALPALLVGARDAGRRWTRRGGGPAHHSEGRPPEWGTAGLGIPTRPSTPVNKLLLGLLHLEARWLKGGRHRLPFGHSLYAIARKV